MQTCRTRWSALAVALLLTAGNWNPIAAEGRSSDSQTQVFRAGAAASNITPPLGQPIVGGWIPHPATHIHDELHARCLVLDDGKTRLAIVLCDNVGIPREVYDAAKNMIHDETGLPTDHMLMAATHTHSATTARAENKLATAEELSDYQAFLARRIADGVRRAIDNLEPAQIGWGSTQAPDQVFNRRWYVSPEAEELLRNPFGGHDTVCMNPPRAHPALIKPAGPVDPEVAFLSVRSQSGRPIALLANYSLHYVGGVRSGDVSADYFALFADRIQQLLNADRLDPPFVGILSNGTSGDVNNINFREKSPRLQPYEKMRQVADYVADKVYAAHQRITFHDWVRLGAVATDLTLQARHPNAEQLAWAHRILEKPNDAEPFHRRENIYAERILSLQDSPHTVSIILQTLRIGDLGIAAIPFEVFAETGLQIKQQGPFQQTFTIELANGSYGYLPTPRQHKLGGYETWLGTNFVETEAVPKIVDTLMDLFARLK